MGSERRNAPNGEREPSSQQCGQIWYVLDTGTGEIVGEKACYSWRCHVCAPKRRAEAMEMMRLRIEAWQDDPDSAPNFVTLTADPSKLPPFIKPGTRDEERYWRALFRDVLRRLNVEETRAGRGRIQWLGVTERGSKSGNWHIHLVTDRLIHVNRWRRACVLGGLGRILKAKRLKGARGAAIYLAKYLQKTQLDATRFKEMTRGLKVLLYSRGCMPSLDVWRWLRIKMPSEEMNSAWVRAWWTPEGTALLREQREAERDQMRRELELRTTGTLYMVGKYQEADGSWKRLRMEELPRRYGRRIVLETNQQLFFLRAGMGGNRFVPPKDLADDVD